MKTVKDLKVGDVLYLCHSVGWMMGKPSISEIKIYKIDINKTIGEYYIEAGCYKFKGKNNDIFVNQLDEYNCLNRTTSVDPAYTDKEGLISYIDEHVEKWINSIVKLKNLKNDLLKEIEGK